MIRNALHRCLLLVCLISTQGFAAKIKYGTWLTQFELAQNIILPSIFQFEKGKPGELIIYNGFESIHLQDIKQTGDSIVVRFPTFDSELCFIIVDKTHIEGAWYNKAKSDTYHVKFTSHYTSDAYYPLDSKQLLNHRKWEVTFDYKGESEKAIGLFNYPNSEQNTNLLHGTFLTETGDYRFLSGATVGDSLYLSCFDGSHAFLFRAQLKNDTLWGDFHSGNHYKTTWMAVPNDDFELSDPDSLTFMVNEKPISFQLQNIDGTTYTYPNESLKNKVVLIQLMGTWCPNCLDESNYLKDLYASYKNELAIISITFETQKTVEGKIEKVTKYKESLDLPFTFLIGGDACKLCAAELFPQLNNISSFPTLIFLDKKGSVRKIHTGFSGPGTGQYYTNFVSETNAFVDALIKE
ncbi:MAG: TlpA family protein disulfide reductase [Crocinitomicaceae bacterium]|nr:TlpA family protein disulfide reductase [Crocinitomicaceae bacterium]MBK8927850.1 TlpA family protein disulfide reductase [Crocinitomicaceae bacterium]